MALLHPPTKSQARLVRTGSLVMELIESSMGPLTHML